MYLRTYRGETFFWRCVYTKWIGSVFGLKLIDVKNSIENDHFYWKSCRSVVSSSIDSTRWSRCKDMEDVTTSLNSPKPKSKQTASTSNRKKDKPRKWKPYLRFWRFLLKRVRWSKKSRKSLGYDFEVSWAEEQAHRTVVPQNHPTMLPSQKESN